MAKPQQPELHRSSLSPTDPASVKSRPPAPAAASGDGPAPVPEENRPGHHPEQDQDKPTERFIARTSRRSPAARPAAAGTAAAGSPGSRAPAGRRNSSPAVEAPEDHTAASPPAPGATSGFGLASPLCAVVPALAFADAARRPDGPWKEIGESKARWLAQITLLPVLGSWRYATSVKPRLEAAERAQSLAGA